MFPRNPGRGSPSSTPKVVKKPAEFVCKVHLLARALGQAHLTIGYIVMNLTGGSTQIFFFVLLSSGIFPTRIAKSCYGYHALGVVHILHNQFFVFTPSPIGKDDD